MKKKNSGDEYGPSPGFRNKNARERSEPVFGNAALNENYLYLFHFFLDLLEYGSIAISRNLVFISYD